MKEKEGSLIILNRSVVIGIIVLVSTVSFTFGYFVGRYSAPGGGKSVETWQEISKPQSGSQSTVLSPPVEEKEPGNEEEESGKAYIEEKVSLSPALEKSAPEAALELPKKKQSSQSQKEASFKKGLYYLQIGAFKDESRAIRLRDDLKKNTTVNTSSYDVIIKKDGSSLHKVYVGSFKTKKEALFAKTRMKKLYGFDSIIIKK